jgi:hypothetical protein
VHHLRKTGAADVLDEITGSTGMTGAVDGTLILKRERGQMDATLFVTGRDVEREQELALRFEAETAQWKLLGSAEEVGRTRARREILDLLREQAAHQEEGMRPREIARALEKNYHTTRALLCKMVESGEVSRVGGRYVALSLEIDHPPRRQEEIHRQPAIPKPGHHSRTPGSGLSMCDAVAGSTHPDYGDYGDEDIETAADGAGESSPGASSGMQEEPHLPARRGALIDMERQEDGRQQESTPASPSSSNQSHHCNHAYHDDTLAGSAEGVGEDPGGEASVKESGPSGPRKPASESLPTSSP